MQRPSAFLALVSLALVWAPAGEAQPGAGANEFGFAAAYLAFTADEEDAVLFLALEYGRFLTDALQLGGGVEIGGPLDDLDEEIDVEVFAQYHFTPEKTTTWYVKGAYVAVLFEGLDVGFLGAGLGFKAYWRENVAFSWEVAYGTSITDAIDGGAVRSLTGLSIFF
jgi:hypothetical protein